MGIRSNICCPKRRVISKRPRKEEAVRLRGSSQTGIESEARLSKELKSVGVVIERAWYSRYKIANLKGNKQGDNLQK